MANRFLLRDFMLANPLYAGAVVTAYLADPVTGIPTTGLAALYKDSVSAARAANPQTLNALGEMNAPVYCEDVIVLYTALADNVTQQTGVIGLESYRSTPSRFLMGNPTWADAAAGNLATQAYTAGGVVAISEAGLPAGVFASRASDGPPAGSITPAHVILSENDATGAVQTTYASYVTARRVGAAGTALGQVLEAVNTGPGVAATPYNMTPSGSTVPLWFTLGRTDAIGQASLTAVLGVVNDGAQAKAGLLFGANSLEPVTGIGGAAIVLPENYGAVWYAHDGSIAANVSSQITSTNGFAQVPALLFQGTGAGIRTADGATAILAQSGHVTLQATQITGALRVTNGGVQSYTSQSAAAAAGAASGTIFRNTTVGALDIVP